MRCSLAASVFVLVATSVYAQGETRTLEPFAPAPTGCDRNYAGSFEITVVPIDGTSSGTAAKRGAIQPNSDTTPLGNVAKRKSAMCMSFGTLVANLNNGVLTDSQGRTGSIVANRQFQFDGPAQAGALYTSGFAVCSPSKHLALGDSTVFYQCSSGNFFNIYDEAIAKQCQPVYIEVIPCDASVMGMNDMASGQIADGQTQNGAGQIADGQIQVPSINQNADGQVQNRPSANQIADGQVQISGSVNQIADGQLQNTGTAQGAQQIADGQTRARQVSDSAAPISATEAAFTNAAVPKRVGRALGAAAVAAAGYAAMI